MTAFRTYGGTEGFIAPEIIAQRGHLDCEDLEGTYEYTVAVDIWALGEIAFRALTQKTPFERGLAAYVKGKLEFPIEKLHAQEVSDQGCDFIARVMKPIPKDRLSASEALSHHWIASQRPVSSSSSEELRR